MERAALADFLRRRREALTPGDLGISAGVRRRTPGLRREEVAAQVGMSTDYYSRLEQQRGPQPSEQMLAALARALRLTPDECDHLFTLAGRSAPRRALRTDHVSPPLLRVLDRLDTPALVINDLGETLVQNRAAALLFGDHTGRTGFARSAVYRWFTDAAERARYPDEDHERQSRMQVAQLRFSASAVTGHPGAGRLVAALLSESSEFAELWQRHEVMRRFEDRKTLLHPEIGGVDLDCQALFTEDQSQTLLVLTAHAGTGADEKLRLLMVIGEQQPVMAVRAAGHADVQALPVAGRQHHPAVAGVHDTGAGAEAIAEVRPMVRTPEPVAGLATALMPVSAIRCRPPSAPDRDPRSSEGQET